MATWAKGVDFKNSANTARVGGVGIYGTDGSAEKAYLGVGTEPWNKTGLEVTSSEVSFKGNKVYHAGSKPTPAEIGAAASSHTHSYVPVSAGGNITVHADSDSSTTTEYLALKAGHNILQITSSGGGSTVTKGQDKLTFNGNIVYHAGRKPTVSEIGAAAASHTHNYAATSHNHGLLHDSFGTTIADTTTDNGWSMINSSYNGFLLKSLRSSSNAPAWLQGNYSAGIAFGGADTKGVMSVAYSSPSVRFAGGNGSKPVWYFTVNGSSGKTYNMDSLAANTANTLATARTINGTSFNGSANITTANWGTARTITIGSTAKSVNGSANVAWTLDEIGAAAASHTHSNYASTSHTHSSLTGTTSSTIAPSTGTGVVRYDYNVSSANAGTLPCSNNANGILTMNTHSGNYYSQLGFSSNGNLYYRAFNGAALDTTTAWKQVAFTNSSITGNAATATKLQTARTINGTNFDGSGNITTANWGTARNIYVADADGTNTGAAVSVNGSGNATLKLPSTIKASLTGNASTATTLATARTIGKASFNGSANITLAQIMGYATTTSSGNAAYVNQWTKFATVDVSGGTYRECTGSFIFSSKEVDAFSGTLQFYFRTGNTVASTGISLRWTELTSSSYANCVAAVKVSDGKYDLYFKPIANYTIMNITALVQQVGYLTLHSNQNYSSSITAAATSSLSACANTANSATTANTATTLATARTINGTSFNGSANITTANWGTARTITIGSTGKSVNGSGNVSWSLSEIGAAAASHTHSYLPLSGGSMTGSIKFSGGGYNNHAIRMEAGDANGAFIGIGAGGLTVIGSGESTNAVRTALTNGADETMIVASDQTIRFLTGVQNGYDSAKEVSINASGVINAPQGMTGNASTATKLQTARTINGTNFDGTGNITTANWGTARNIQIGNTSKSVNGSGNVAWSLNEIGAAAASHTHSYLPLSGGTITGHTTLNNNVNIIGKTGADIADSTGATVAAGTTGTLISYNASHNFHLGAIMTDKKLTVGNTYLNAAHHMYLRNVTSDGTIYLQVGGSTRMAVNSTATTVSKLVSNGGITTGGSIVSDTALTDNLGSSSIPFNVGYAKQLNLVGEASKGYGYLSAYTVGTTSTNGEARLVLGNSTASGTASNASGSLFLYGTGAGYTRIIPSNNTGSNYTQYFPIGNGSIPLMNKADTNYWGMVTPDGGTSNWIRTTTSGIIPSNQNKESSIGTSSWQFKAMYATTFYGALSGNASTATKLATARTIALGGILSGSASFDGSGNITITAAANDITTITKSLKVTTSWMDTGITGSNLGTGTYAVQMYVNDGTNTSQYQEYYSGMMSWFNGTTNSTDADEILLHKAGHASNGRHVYLRTLRAASSGYLKLQISCTHAFSAASNITFKFKKLI